GGGGAPRGGLEPGPRGAPPGPPGRRRGGRARRRGRPLLAPALPRRLERERHHEEGDAEDDEQDEAHEDRAATTVLPARPQLPRLPRLGQSGVVSVDGVRLHPFLIAGERLVRRLAEDLTVRADESPREGGGRKRGEIVRL